MKIILLLALLVSVNGFSVSKSNNTWVDTLMNMSLKDAAKTDNMTLGGLFDEVIKGLKPVNETRKDAIYLVEKIFFESDPETPSGQLAAEEKALMEDLIEIEEDLKEKKKKGKKRTLVIRDREAEVKETLDEVYDSLNKVKDFIAGATKA